jgi:HJR/Mrr/RecB family endonuclease
VELAAASGFTITQGKRLTGREADIVVEKGAEKVVVELKRISLKLSVRGIAHRAVEQVSLYLHEPDVVGAVALIYSAGAKEYDVIPAPGILSDRVRIVAPHANKAPPA